MKHLTIIAAIILILATTLLIADEDRPMKGRHHDIQDGKGNNRERMTEELNLTPDQEKQMREIHREFERKTADIQNEIRKLNIDREEAMEKEDWVKVKKVIDQVHLKKADLAKSRVDMHEKILKVLTPEQRETFKKIHADRPGPGRMQRGMGRGDCDGDCEDDEDCGPGMMPKGRK